MRDCRSCLQLLSENLRYKLNSGGRINGKPHQMVDELTTDSSAIYRHIKEMLQQEYDRLNNDSFEDVRLTALARSLDDLDVTLCSYAVVGLPFSELERKLQEKEAPKKTKKYKGMGSVPANADGIVKLLRENERFPSTIFPAIVQASFFYNVDPAEILPEIKKLN